MSKNTKTLSSEEAISKLAAEDRSVPGTRTSKSMASKSPPAPRTGQASNMKPLDPSTWEQAGQAAFSQALGKPSPREPFGSPGKNSGESNFGGKGKKAA